MPFDLKDYGFAEFAYGRHAEEINGTDSFRQALFLKGLIYPAGKLVIEPWLYEMLPEIEAVRVVKDR